MNEILNDSTSWGVEANKIQDNFQNKTVNKETYADPLTYDEDINAESEDTILMRDAVNGKVGFTTIDAVRSRHMLLPAYHSSSTENKKVNIDTFNNNISFFAPFTVIGRGGGEYTSVIDQNVPIRPERFNTGEETTSSTGVLIMNKETKEIKNIYWGDWKSLMTKEYLTFGIIKRSTGSLTEVGDVQVIGMFPYSINGNREPFAQINPSFYFSSTDNKVVELNTNTSVIKIPAPFVVFDNLGKSYATSLEQVVELKGSRFLTGEIVTSATSVLIINKETKEIKNIYWGDWDDLSEDYLTFGIIKRSTGSLTEVGDVQVIGMFPYSINGSGANEEDVVSRNQDAQMLALASIAPKYVGGVMTHRFNMLHTSDIHGDTVTTRNFINYLNSLDIIDQALISGDFLRNDFSEDFSSLLNTLNTTNKPVLPVIGNHDVGSSKIVAACGTHAEVYNKFIAPLKTKAGLITDGQNYWYKDDATHKIRTIGLYEYDDANDLDSVDPSLYRVTRGTRIYRQVQIDWFINTLLNTPSDYAVIVITHQQPTTDEAMLVPYPEWHSDGAYNIINTMAGTPIPDIIQAFINGTTINTNYDYFGDADYLGSVDAVADFSTRGTGEFITYLFGHHHNDSCGVLSIYNNQHYIAVTNGTVDKAQSQFDDLSRVEGTKSEDAFNLISVDRVLKQVYIVRIGANINNNLIDRKYFKFSY